MKIIRFMFILCLFLSFVSFARAEEGMTASKENIIQLKKDLRDGLVQVGKTRQKDIRRKYGLPEKITDSEKKATYDYGDLKIDFYKVKYMKRWEYDYSKKPGYSDDIDDLRFDLEDQQIVGNYWTLKEIRKDYQEPTERQETDNDGGISIYWYGEIKLTFENFIFVKGWKGKDLNKISSEGVLGGK